MKLFLRLAALVTIGVLLALMLGPSPGVEQSIPHLDKLAHVVAFFLIAASLRILFPRLSFVLISVATLGVGAGVEIIQGFVGRDPSLGDMAADAVGVGLAWLARPVLHRLRLRLMGED